MKTNFSVYCKLLFTILIIFGMIFDHIDIEADAPGPKPHVCWVIDAEFINTLSSPQSPEELRKAYKNLFYHDVVLDMLYFTRLRKMRRVEKDDIDFLKSMPKNPVEFSFLYSVTYPENISLFPQLNNAYATYFEDLADLVIQHPEFLEKYFLLVYFSDGEVSDRLEACVTKIQKAIPKKFNAVLKKLPAKVRTRINAY